MSTVLWIFSMFSSVINCNGHFSNIVIVPAPQFPHFLLFKTVLTLLRFPVIPPSKSTLAPELCQPFFFESAANSVLKKESTLVASQLLSLIFSLAVFDCLLQYKKLELQIIRLFWKLVLSTVLWIFSMFSSVINCNGHFSNKVIVPAPYFPHFFLVTTVLTLLRFPVIPPSKRTISTRVMSAVLSWNDSKCSYEKRIYFGYL